jgi:RNA polymerase sigma-70 factor (ECF subfamily)
MPAESQVEEPSDVELIERAWAGDVGAFGMLFRRFHRVVFRFARLMTSSAETAEDVTQDVFLTLLRDIRRYDPARSNFKTYVFGITRNLSRRYRRRDQWLRPFSGAEQDDRATNAPDADERMEQVEMAAQVRAALRRVPARYREVILLCDLHELTYAEAATVTGASVASVRARLHRGRHMLRERLRRMRKAAGSERLSTMRCTV